VAAARGVGVSVAAAWGVGVGSVAAARPRDGGGGTSTPARAPPPENVLRRAGLGDLRETAAGVDARRAGLGERREAAGVDARLGLGARVEDVIDARRTGLGARVEDVIDARRGLGSRTPRARRAAASAAPVASRAIGDGDRARRAAARGGEKKKLRPSPRLPRVTSRMLAVAATASRTALFISDKSALLSRDRGDRGDARRGDVRSWASLRSASSSVEQRSNSWLPGLSSTLLISSFLVGCSTGCDVASSMLR